MTGKIAPTELYYCLNPSCPQGTARVLHKKKMNNLHQDCTNWIISEKDIASLQFFTFPFDPETPLNYKTQPFLTQAYLFSNKQHITCFMNRYYKTLKEEIMKELNQFEAHICKSLNRLFNFRKYKEIDELSKEKGINASEKSNRLSQLLKRPLPLYDDIKLPTLKNSEEILSSFHQDLSRLFVFNPEEVPADKNECETDKNETLLVKLEEPDIKSKRMSRIIINSTPDETFLDIQTEPSIRNMEVKEEMSNKKDTFNLVKSELSQLEQLQQYIHKNCNLRTAMHLMGQPLQKFYEPTPDEKIVRIKCLYCEFHIELKTKSKPQTNSACSYAILEHLLKEHFSLAFQNYTLLKSKIEVLSFTELCQKIEIEDLKSIGIIDRSSLPEKNSLTNFEESDLMIELNYGEKRPRFRSTMFRGGTPKEIQVLFGYLICYTTVIGKKKFTIYTNEHKGDILSSFCKQYRIEDVKIFSENDGKDATIVKKEAIVESKDTE